ncbi:acyl-CoA/acyl-ACP dehydrogenase [Mycobacterium sp. NBC_00419]|uniref:acyl-CoA dehydrogenase family protein n=1 Tax=Mycobacterium sp. NBC_00419 TaxID=2975989 RepID=UPI002E1CC377
MTGSVNTTDAEWKLVEDSVFGLFDELPTDAYAPIEGRLTDLGFAEIEEEYPVEAEELLFRAQGRSLAQTDCLYRVMLAELPRDLRTASAVLLPAPGSDPAAPPERAQGVILGPASGTVLVPLQTGDGIVASLVAAECLHAAPADTFDPTVRWTHLRSAGSGTTEPVFDITAQWTRAVSAAQRALATEIIALADQVIRLAVDHVSLRKQFGSHIGALQSPRHALANAFSTVEGARALLGEAWRYGGPMGAQAAKATAGRAHRAASDVALQVCGAIGLTSEHDLHRFVRRGFQLNVLCGSPAQLESQVARRLFDSYPADLGLPTVIASSR